MRQNPEAVLHLFLPADQGREGKERRHQDSHGLIHRQDRVSVLQDCAHGRFLRRVVPRRAVYDAGGFPLGCLDETFLCQGFQYLPGCAHSHMVYFAELAHGGERTSVRKKSGLNLFPQTLV